MLEWSSDNRDAAVNDEKSSNGEINIPETVVTPSFVKSIAWFIINLAALDPDIVTDQLNSHKLIQCFFRLVVKISWSVNRLLADIFFFFFLDV